jgi:hypothetical protein
MIFKLIHKMKRQEMAKQSLKKIRMKKVGLLFILISVHTLGFSQQKGYNFISNPINNGYFADPYYFPIQINF